jgi:hypothetical protein
MLAAYLQKKLDQYRKASRLADNAWAEVAAFNQAGGEVKLEDEERSLLRNIPGNPLKDIDDINESLRTLQDINLDSLIAKLNGVKLPEDKQMAALDALVKSLQLIKSDLNTQASRIKEDKMKLDEVLRTTPNRRTR